MGDPAPAQALNPNQPFDIYATYREKLGSAPPGLAAVAALTSALTEHRLTTASEAISLLSNLDKTLKSRLKNPIPASAGTGAFLQYLVTNVAPPGTDDASDFDQTVKNILAAGDEFVRRGLLATKTIAKYGRRLVKDGCIVVVVSVDDAMLELLTDAAEADVRFKVVLVETDAHSVDSLGKLKQQEVPIINVRPEALAHTLALLSGGISANVRSQTANEGVLLLGAASAIISNGAILAAMGTMQACMVAQMLGIRTYIVSETWKSVRLLAVGAAGESFSAPLNWGASNGKTLNGSGTGHDSKDPSDKPMDLTPPQYITGVVTERGIHSTAALSEEAIKYWF